MRIYANAYLTRALRLNHSSLECDLRYIGPLVVKGYICHFCKLANTPFQGDESIKKLNFCS